MTRINEFKVRMEYQTEDCLPQKFILKIFSKMSREVSKISVLRNAKLQLEYDSFTDFSLEAK